MINHVQFPKLGIELTINRVAFSIAGFDIYWYGILFTTAVITGAAVALYMGKKLGIDDDDFIDIMIVGTIFGIIGARAYYVAFAPFEYETLWDMINLRDGGIGVYGGLIAGLVSGWFACRWKKIRFFDAADCVFTGFLFGQTFGRWANFMNQEAFGDITTLPWRMRLFVSEYQAVEVHPTFFYESLWNLIGLLLLLFVISKGRRFDGENTWFYFLWYGVGRFWIEGLRTDSLYLFDWTILGQPVRVSQALSAVMIVVAAFMLFYNLGIKKKTADGLWVNRQAAAKAAESAAAEVTAEGEAPMGELPETHENTEENDHGDQN